MLLVLEQLGFTVSVVAIGAERALSTLVVEPTHYGLVFTGVRRCQSRRRSCVRRSFFAGRVRMMGVLLSLLDTAVLGRRRGRCAAQCFEDLLIKGRTMLHLLR